MQRWLNYNAKLTNGSQLGLVPTSVAHARSASVASLRGEASWSCIVGLDSLWSAFQYAKPTRVLATPRTFALLGARAERVAAGDDEEQADAAVRALVGGNVRLCRVSGARPDMDVEHGVRRVERQALRRVQLPRPSRFRVTEDQQVVDVQLRERPEVGASRMRRLSAARFWCVRRAFLRLLERSDSGRRVRRRLLRRATWASAPGGPRAACHHWQGVERGEASFRRVHKPGRSGSRARGGLGSAGERRRGAAAAEVEWRWGWEWWRRPSTSPQAHARQGATRVAASQFRPRPLSTPSTRQRESSLGSGALANQWVSRRAMCPVLWWWSTVMSMKTGAPWALSRHRTSKKRTNHDVPFNPARSISTPSSKPFRTPSTPFQPPLPPFHLTNAPPQPLHHRISRIKRSRVLNELYREQLDALYARANAAAAQNERGRRVDRSS